jgi:CCR4-NOT transcriptional regulation complex NOT5 subunit
MPDDGPAPNQQLLQPEFFANYDLSTLFYAFFYSQRNGVQLSAANELKRRGWLFHAQLQTWLRRTGEPTEATEAYEVANYDCFEPDAWAVRPRPAFRLEFASRAGSDDSLRLVEGS